MAEGADETAGRGRGIGSEGSADPSGAAEAGQAGPGEGARASGSTRTRRIWVRVILVVATILAVFAIFAIWANRQLLNPSNWAKTSTALLQKETVRVAVSGYLVDQLYANVNIEHELKSGLPKQLQPLAGPISGGLHSLAEKGAERALEIPQVQAAWEKANRTADQALVTIVNGGGKRVKIHGGTVSLDLRTIVGELTDRLGLPSGIAEKLPPSVGDLKIVTSSQLGLVRTGAKALHALALVLTILVFVLYLFAVFLARGRRRRALMWVGWSLVFSGLVVILGRKIGQAQLVSAITSDASIEPAANDAYAVATALLVQVASAAIIIGIPVILSAWVAGPSRLAIAGRRFWAPHLRERPSLAYWITAAVLALVFIWGPIPATRNLWEMLLFTILAFLGTYVLSKQIAEQFPHAQAIPWRASLSDAARSLSEKAGRSQAAGAANVSSKAAELERLAALHGRGALSDEEYAAAKRDVLSVD